jgi:Rrf2 family protein
VKLSKSTELALHGLFQLATIGPRQLLVAELVKSTRGKKGGFTLARNPEQITLADIVRAVEAEEPLFECLGGQRGCKANGDCAVLGCFHEAEERLYRTLEATSLGDLLESNHDGRRDAWLVR